MSEKKRRVGEWTDDRKQIESALALLERRGTEPDVLVRAIDSNRELFRMLLHFLSHSDVTPLLATSRWYREFWEHDERAVRAPFDMNITLDDSKALVDPETQDPSDRLVRFLHSVRRQWTRVREMKLKVDTASDTRAVEIETILDRLPTSLRALSIDVDDSAGDEVKAVSLALPVILDRCRGLERLAFDVDGGYDWDFRIFTADVLAGLNRMNNLTRLAVNEPLNNRTLDALVAWPGFAQLVEWTVYIGDTAPAMSKLVGALKTAKTLTKINLSISDADAEFEYKVLLEALPVGLQDINVWAHGLPMTDYAAATAQLSRLEKFGGVFAGTDVKSLAAVMQRNAALEELSMFCTHLNTNFGNQQPGVELFEATMRTCPKLKRLQLAFETKGQEAKLPDTAILGRWLTTHPLAVLDSPYSLAASSQSNRWRIQSITGKDIRDARIVEFLKTSNVRVDQFVTTAKTWEQDQWDLVRSRVTLFCDVPDETVNASGVKGASITSFTTADAKERVFMHLDSPLFSATYRTPSPVVRFSPSIRCDMDAKMFRQISDCFAGARSLTLTFPGSKAGFTPHSYLKLCIVQVDWKDVAFYIWRRSLHLPTVFFDWPLPASVVVTLLEAFGSKSWGDVTEPLRLVCVQLQDDAAEAEVGTLRDLVVGKWKLCVVVHNRQCYIVIDE